jgi:HEAT repeat protein
MRLLVLSCVLAASASAQSEPTLDAADPEQVGRAIEALAHRGDRASITAISQRIDQGLPSQLVLRAIDALESVPASASLIARLATHRRPAVRARVARALGTMHADASRSVLADLLDDPDPAVRSAAAIALGQVGAQTVSETLLLAAVRGVDEAAIVLGQQASSAQVPRVLRRLAPDSLDELAPALRIFLERPNLPRTTKTAIVQRLVQVRGATAEHLLREVGATLQPQDPLLTAINEALGTFAPAEPAQ